MVTASARSHGGVWPTFTTCWYKNPNSYKVICKAAASLMILGGVRQGYTRTISQPALRLLQEAGVMVSCDEVVDHIINRDHTGWCPLEQASRDLQSAKEIFPVIEKFISSQRKNI